MQTEAVLPYIVEESEKLILEGFRFLLKRSDDAEDYPFVDMKFKVLTGESFAREASNVRTIYDRNVIYGVTQGRAIESIVGHLLWLESNKILDPIERRTLIRKGRILLERVICTLEQVRLRLGEHLCFMFSVDGTALQVLEDGRVTAWRTPQGNTDTDLFYAKGLLAAANYLGDWELQETADIYYRSVVEDALNDALINDRQPMDPKNPVVPLPGRITHGPKMLALGGIATGIMQAVHPRYWELGAQLIRQIANSHINLGQFDSLQIGDFIEFVDTSGHPWVDDSDCVWSDPGHALEFVGLASKVILAMNASESIEPWQIELRQFLNELAGTTFPQVFQSAYKVGYKHDSGGIVKAVDLRTRTPVNDDMPWWNLPETIRAAVLLTQLLPTLDKEPYYQVAQFCMKSTMCNYARSQFGYLPIQTRNRVGMPVDVIPAIPDADPLYHTGLTLLDAIGYFR